MSLNPPNFALHAAVVKQATIWERAEHEDLAKL